MVEVIVSLLVMSIGLLGMASLQGKSLQSNQGAYYHSQASISSYDILERLRSNKTDAVSGLYNHSQDDETPNVIEGDIASTDLNDWLTLIENNLPDGAGEISCDADATCTIRIQWLDHSVTSDLNGDGVFDQKDKQQSINLVTTL